MVRHFLTLGEYDADEIREILNRAIEVKKNPAEYADALKNKTLIMLFQKTSTRTRLSFEAGMTQLGGHAIFLDWRTTQFTMAEFIDEIRAAMRFGDVLMYRALKHANIREAERVARIPIINALCERYHPCQAMADALTMIEKSGGKVESLRGKRLVYMGVANNVSNSLIEVCTKLGMHITLCIGEKDPLSKDNELERKAKATGLYEETSDLNCLSDADFAYTDAWLNIEYFDNEGEVIGKFRKEFERRKKALMPFQLNIAVLKKYHSKAKIMHDMPCHTGYEISREAVEHSDSIIFDQAENRLHAQKAILLHLLRR